jgi:hypothetical protein
MGALEYILSGVVLFFGPDIINNASVGVTIPLLALVGIKIFGVLLILAGVGSGIWGFLFPTTKDSNEVRAQAGKKVASMAGSAILSAATKKKKTVSNIPTKQSYLDSGYTIVTKPATSMPIGISYGYARKPKGASKAAVNRKVVKKKVKAKAKAYSRSKNPKKEPGLLERIIRFIKGAFKR